MCGDGTVVGGGYRQPREEAPAIVQAEDDSGLDQGGGKAVEKMVSFYMYSEGRAHRVCRWMGYGG